MVGVEADIVLLSNRRSADVGPAFNVIINRMQGGERVKMHLNSEIYLKKNIACFVFRKSHVFVSALQLSCWRTNNRLRARGVCAIAKPLLHIGNNACMSV
jgi:hypothetical protein